jgi:hypothetical protein
MTQTATMPRSGRPDLQPVRDRLARLEAAAAALARQDDAFFGRGRTLALLSLQAPADGQGCSLLTLRLAADGVLQQAFEAASSRGLTAFVQRCLDVAREFANGEEFCQWRKHVARLAETQDRAKAEGVRAQQALSRAGNQLAAGEDPSPEEREYRESLANQTVFLNRCGPLAVLVRDSQRKAARALAAELAALRGRAQAEAETERTRLAAEVPLQLSVEGLLQFRSAAVLAAELARRHDDEVRGFVTTALDHWAAVGRSVALPAGLEELLRLELPTRRYGG